MITNNDAIKYKSGENVFGKFSELKVSNSDIIGTRLFTFLMIGVVILGTFAVSWLIW
ncbi:MAG: hypothetical protein M1431_04930 [Candidatus Thermoplasmatota archaeon]|nr:hypothetical protein [Candidatus Thermoplasmatota archaeon]